MMNRIYFILIALFAMFYIVIEIRKKRFSIKESFWWMSASGLMLLLAIFPYSINWIAKLFGVEYPPSLLFVFCIIFLNKNLKIIVDKQAEMLYILIRTKS